MNGRRNEKEKEELWWNKKRNMIQIEKGIKI